MEENRKKSDILFAKKVEESISNLIDERKLRYIADTNEFIEGMLIGLEIAALHGDKMHEIYKNSRTTVD